MKGCQFEFKCQNDADGYPVPGTCALFAPLNSAPKTISQEFVRYLRGYEVVKKRFNTAQPSELAAFGFFSCD